MIAPVPVHCFSLTFNFPKKAESGLNFPKKAENGLNFPKKADIIEDVMPCPCTETDAKCFANSFTETYTDSILTLAK